MKCEDCDKELKKGKANFGQYLIPLCNECYSKSLWHDRRIKAYLNPPIKITRKTRLVHYCVKNILFHEFFEPIIKISIEGDKNVLYPIKRLSKKGS